jgi:hypothetical protein
LAAVQRTQAAAAMTAAVWATTGLRATGRKRCTASAMARAGRGSSGGMSANCCGVLRCGRHSKMGGPGRGTFRLIKEAAADTGVTRVPAASTGE